MAHLEGHDAGQQRRRRAAVDRDEQHGVLHLGPTVPGEVAEGRHQQRVPRGVGDGEAGRGPQHSRADWRGHRPVVDVEDRDPRRREVGLAALLDGAGASDRDVLAIGASARALQLARPGMRWTATTASVVVSMTAIRESPPGRSSAARSAAPPRALPRGPSGSGSGRGPSRPVRAPPRGRCDRRFRGGRRGIDDQDVAAAVEALAARIRVGGVARRVSLALGDRDPILEVRVETGAQRQLAYRHPVLHADPGEDAGRERSRRTASWPLPISSSAPRRRQTAARSGRTRWSRTR